MNTNTILSRVIIWVAGLLIAAALGLVAYIYIDLALHPTDMAFQLIAVPPLVCLSGGALGAWVGAALLTRRGRTRGECCALGALAALLTLAFSVLITVAVGSVGGRAELWWSYWIVGGALGGGLALVAVVAFQRLAGRRT